MKKRIISIVIVFVFVLAFFSSFTICMAEGNATIHVPTVRQDVFVYDDDNIIDDSVEQNLNEMLVLLEKKTEIEFAVITTPSLNSNTIERYANSVFNTLGIGKKGKDNGILLLISRSDKRVRLEIGRGLEGILIDSKCGRILDEFFVPYREKDEYTRATELTVQAVINVFCEEYDITIDGLDTKSVKLEEEPGKISTLAIILIVITILVLIVFFVSLIVDGSSDGGSSGSFFSSGGSSGGGFSGGFGGGFSGGGGASR